MLIKIPKCFYNSTMHEEQVFIHFFLIFVEASLCTPNPCENNGTCILEQPSFKCNCTPEYEGKRCETGKLMISAYVQAGFPCRDHTPNFGCSHKPIDLSPKFSKFRITVALTNGQLDWASRPQRFWLVPNHVSFTWNYLQFPRAIAMLKTNNTVHW